MGRGRWPATKTRLTKELTEEIGNLLLDGNYIETACAVVGLGKKQFYQFLRIGKDAEERLERIEGLRLTPEEKKCVEFRNVVRSAIAEAEARDLRTIRLAGQRDWKALAWRLERRNPKRWGRRSDITSGGEPIKGGVPLGVLREFLDEEDGPEDDNPNPEEGDRE
jgi:transposase